MTGRRTILALLILAAAGVSGVVRAAEDDPSPKITGTVVYRERVPLPADAIVHVRLEVAGAPEMPARRITEITIRADGRQVPISFELPYAEAAIDPRKRHFVRASISSGDRTLFASRSPYPVITLGAPTRVEVLVQQSGGAKPRPPAPAAGLDLGGSEWKLVALGETPAAGEPETHAATLVFESAKNRISGSVGCNRFTGTWTAGESSRLRLDPSGLTRMACPDPAMRQETAFLAALRAATDYRVESGKLELLDGRRVVARFESSGGAGTRTE